MFIVPSVITFLTPSCTETIYYDVHGIENGAVYCYSNGQKYDVDLSDFTLCSENLYYTDSITMDDAVATANDGFRIRSSELIDVENLGNYEIRKYHYKVVFLIYIQSFSHETYYRYLPFEFEGKELWLNNKPIIPQPIVFERGEATVTELPLSDGDNGLYAKYLIDYHINVYYRCDARKLSEFTYVYEVARKDVSVWDGNNGDITVTVTYDWKPDN